MSGLEIFLGVVLGLLVNETCDVSPWMARKLVEKAAALQYRDVDRAAVRAEELAAVINDRPGKLFKLATAAAFTFSALIARLMLLMQDFWNFLRLFLPVVLAASRVSTAIPRLKEKKDKKATIRGGIGESKSKAAIAAAGFLRDGQDPFRIKVPVEATPSELEEHVRRLLELSCTSVHDRPADETW